MFISSELLVSITSPIFVALHLPVSEIANVLPEGVYCCFSRTTLSTTMFTMCNAYTKFFLIGCFSELHAHLCPYCNVWPEVVLQELHCLPTN